MICLILQISDEPFPPKSVAAAVVTRAQAKKASKSLKAMSVRCLGR